MYDLNELLRQRKELVTAGQREEDATIEPIRGADDSQRIHDERIGFY